MRAITNDFHVFNDKIKIKGVKKHTWAKWFFGYNSESDANTIGSGVIYGKKARIKKSIWKGKETLGNCSKLFLSLVFTGSSLLRLFSDIALALA